MARDPAARAPRGTRTIAQAFFQAVEEIPEDRRADVVKAALSLIRDQIKDARGRKRAPQSKKRAGPKQPAKKAASCKQAKRAAAAPDEPVQDETTEEGGI